jgi:membrane protease YdiL (CAAX protease family)
MDSENFPAQQSQPESETERHPHLTILQAFGLIILLLVTQLLLSRLFLISGETSLGESHWFGISISHALSGLITVKAGAILAGFSVITLFFGPRFQFLLLLPLAVASCGVTILASELGNILHWVQPIPQEYLDFIDQLFNQNFWGVLFTIGVVAPVVEELLFRGVILDGLQIRYSVRTAVMVSSALFGLTHILPHAVVNAFLLGFFFAWLKLKTGSLRLCIIAHALYNSVPLILSEYVNVQIPGFNTTPGATAQFQPLWLDAIGAVCLILGIAGIRALHEPEPSEPLEVELKS